MGHPIGFDLDLLRSFIAIAEEKSFTRAAARVGRTQSAVSLQMHRLEGVLGRAVLVRNKGGSVELNQDGQYLLGRARELLALNDDIMRAMHAVPASGTIRLGIAEELSARFLPRILERFGQAAPTVEVQVTTAASCLLALQLKNAELDLALIGAGLAPRQWPAVEIWRNPLVWITSDTYRQHLRDPLPMTLPPAECPWRPPWVAECWRNGITIRALEQSGRRYRVVSTSGTTAGQVAAAQAGLAVACTLADYRLPEGLRHVREDEGLPALPECPFLMFKASDPNQPATNIMATEIHDIFGNFASIES